MLLAGILPALSLGLAAYLFARAQAAAHLAFAQRAQRLQTAVTERLSLPAKALATLQSILEASGQLTRKQFRVLTDPMLRRDRVLYALEWLPVVPDGARAAYEAEARTAGLTDYRFWENGPSGRPRDAGRRAYYVPIHYMEPPSAVALGFDIAADPGRWLTAGKARDSGQIAASAPFHLLEDARMPEASAAVGLYAPVYRDGDPGSEGGRRASLTGFAMAIYRSPEMTMRIRWTETARLLALQLESDGQWVDFRRFGFGPAGLEESAVDSLVRAVRNEVGETSTDAD